MPALAGVTFNPAHLTITWIEEWQRAQFRFCAAKELAGSAGNGEITFYAGPVLVATANLAMLFEDQPVTTAANNLEEAEETADAEVRGHRYEDVFASYSRKDRAVVLACRNTYKALGVRVYMDVASLRSGEYFEERLKHLIESSDVFQLFWSRHSANSPYVRQEWQYALRCQRGEGFIRPVYWEEPLVPPPSELARMNFAYVEMPRMRRGILKLAPGLRDSTRWHNYQSLLARISLIIGLLTPLIVFVLDASFLKLLVPALGIGSINLIVPLLTLGFAVPFLAIVAGHIGVYHAKGMVAVRKTRRRALTGLTLGYIYLIFGALVVALFILANRLGLV